MDVNRIKNANAQAESSEEWHGLSTEQFPVSAYVGSSKNLKDLKVLGKCTLGAFFFINRTAPYERGSPVILPATGVPRS